MTHPRNLSETVDSFPSSLDVLGSPASGLVDIILDCNDTVLQRIRLTTDLAHILRAKLSYKLDVQ
ncbi:Uncharacterised protein [Mycobacteroides abscessus subsp. abscessus]|nr:Uncharacterised protein [Mycobacteroides abscessus subsp. abscessus]SID11562.1 Uncharacterised protein [Mycobacteroides abscessus subsp. abscessus]SIE18382.1 Uncharacterised protein [Mycobacteroides abscessus subsp. abscessus]SIH46740.1 Uncharacterised protein [Mycobacteroides abscessus subsp. abscessus]SKK57930.1 Uncharacterised protein [Mycobacteroides abscessus subsp. abscessus]